MSNNYFVINDLGTVGQTPVYGIINLPEQLLLVDASWIFSSALRRLYVYQREGIIISMIIRNKLYDLQVYMRVLE